MTTVRPAALDRWYRILDDPSPLVRQAPTAISMLVAVTLSLTVPDLTIDAVGRTWAGVAVVVLATVVAWVATRLRLADGLIVALIPIADLIGLGLIRAGTGASTSIFGVLLLLPIIWIASRPGIRQVAVIGVLTTVIIGLPYLADPPQSASQLLRVLVVPVTYTVIGALVNELSRLAREHLAEAQALAQQRAEALDENLRVLADLQTSESRYLELLEMFRSVWNATTAQAVIGTDTEGLIMAWNPGATELLQYEDIDVEFTARIEGVFPPSVLGDPEAQSTAPHGDPLPPGLRAIFREADAGLVVTRELEMVRADSSTVPVRLTVTQRRNGTGQPVGYLLIAIDETHAIEVARMKDDFVGMISHELRTPLSSILGYLELLRDDPQHPLTEEQLQFLGVAERNARRLLRLVGDLLFTAQVESGHFPLDASMTDLVGVVTASAESARPAAESAGIELVTEIPDSPVVLRADATRLGQAVDNLVSNALKFTPRGGHVRVCLTTDDEHATITVRDTGLGIPPDELDRLFTRFFRASTATRNAVPGVGLGLNITKAIVTAHGGTMDVDSEEGAGTEFRILLPLTPG